MLEIIKQHKIFLLFFSITAKLTEKPLINKDLTSALWFTQVTHYTPYGFILCGCLDISNLITWKVSSPPPRRACSSSGQLFITVIALEQMEQLPRCFVQVVRDSRINFPISLPVSQLVSFLARFGDLEIHFDCSSFLPDIYRLDRLNKMSYCSFHQNS